jgi:Calcineurin-like phosphoesterase
MTFIIYIMIQFCRDMSPCLGTANEDKFGIDSLQEVVMKGTIITWMLLAFFLIAAGSGTFGQDEGKNQAAGCPIHFAVIGDRTGGHVAGIYEQIVAEVERLRPDFVVNVGDMIEGYSTDTSLLKNQWEEYMQIISPLTMPVYMTPGNHDITFDAALGMYERYVGKPYYSFDIKGLHFIVLDNSRWESSATLPKEQLDWLAADLKEHQNARYIFVLQHKPFWYNSTADNRPDTLHTLFRNFGVDAVITGHFHDYFSGRFDGIIYTGLGSSGGEASVGPTGLQYHFLWVTVDDKGIAMAPVKLGSVLPWNEVTVAEEKFIERMHRRGVSFIAPMLIGSNLELLDSVLAVKLRNLSPDIDWEDTIKWEVPQGWRVTPEILPVNISKGDSSLASFAIRHVGKLFPTPTISVRFPVAAGKSSVAQQTLPLQREILVGRAVRVPVIDGVIDEDVWGKATANLFNPEGGEMALDSTFFYFTYDKDNLYLGASCREKKIDSLAANVTDRDGAIYAEDCVGYFLQPDLEKDVVYQFYFNPRGAIFDQKITEEIAGNLVSDRNWNGQYDVKTTEGTDYWSIEVKVPLEQFGISARANDQMGLNFRRKQFRLKSAADWQVPLVGDPRGLGKMVLF